MSGRRVQRFALAVVVMLVAAVSYVAGAARGTATAHAAPSAPVLALQEGDGGVCWHTQLSQYQCPDSSSRYRMVGATERAGAALALVTAENRLRMIPIPGNVDAIFLTPAGVENFLLRYYSSTNNPAAGQVREFLRVTQIPR